MRDARVCSWLVPILGLILLSSCAINGQDNADPVQPNGQTNGGATNGAAPPPRGAGGAPLRGSAPRVPPPGRGRGRACESIAEALQGYDFLSTLRVAATNAGIAKALTDKNATITLLAPTNTVSTVAIDV